MAANDKVTYTGRAIRIDNVLVAVVEIACPVCGTETIVLPDHHIAGLVDVLHSVMTEHPDLFQTPVESGEATRGVIPLGRVPSC